MRRSLFFLWVVAASIVLVPRAANADVFYESENLSINRWHLHLSNHTFEAESGQTGVLDIQRITPHLTIQAGFVFLNRRLIPLKRFFNSGDQTYQRTVKLRQRNRMRVFLIGSPGASIRIGIRTKTETLSPSVEISATPASIDAGSTSTLAWSSTHATTCVIEPDVGPVEAQGTVTVSPASTTTYTITATGDGKTASASVTINVNYPIPTVEISASPNSIGLDSDATLSWNSTNADTCEIQPVIGIVETNGSMRVAPSETTTYAITATGPGGTATAQTTITVSAPLPIPSCRLIPDTIIVGESAVLHWRGTFATSAVIEPGIGSVGGSGSMTVSPTKTTTFLIVFSGPGGTASTSVTLTVNLPPPQISFSATPNEIDFGGQATLTWTSQAVEHVSIDQGIGDVSLNGSMMVIPQSDTTYTITAAGPGGTATRSVMVAVRSPISIDILSPADGAIVERPDIMVHGTVDNSTGKETGITVNGKVAMIHGNRFVVNHVPLQEGINTITATATDTDGHIHSIDAAVNAAMPEHHINLLANIESGAAPLEMTLSIDGTFSIEDVILSHSGIEPDELIEVAADEYQAAFNEEGITFLTAETTHGALTCRDSIGVLVVDRTSIDELLRQKWDGMKSHLANKDVAQAITYFDEHKKGLYEEVFSALLDRLPQIANDMQDLSLVSIDHRSAKYRIRRIETHNTGTFEVTYYVYFIKDETGIWRIYRF